MNQKTTNEKYPFKNKKEAIKEIEIIINESVDGYKQLDDRTEARVARICSSYGLANLAKIFWKQAGDTLSKEDPFDIDRLKKYYEKSFYTTNEANEHIALNLINEGTKKYLSELTRSLAVPYLDVGSEHADLYFQYAIYAYGYVTPETNLDKKRIKRKIEFCEQWMEKSKNLNPIKLETFTKYTQK